MTYNPDIHHRRSIRLRDYDYSQAGAYFVTVCAQDRECLFGDVVGGEMRLNKYGEIVAESWTWLPRQYRHIDLNEWIVMPNHLHGILIIDENCLCNSQCMGGSRTAHTIRKPLG